MSAACYYSGPLNLGALDALSPLGTLILRMSGEADIVIDLNQLTDTAFDGSTSQTFWHWFNTSALVVRGTDRNKSVRYPWFSLNSLGLCLQNKINALTTTGGHSWPTSNFQVQWLESQAGVAIPFYKIIYGSAFTYQFSTLAGAALFGVQTTALSTAANTHFWGTPRSVVWPETIPGICVDDDLDGVDYESQGIASMMVSESGRVMGMSPYEAVLQRDFWHQFVPPQYVFAPDARAAGVLWAFEDLFKELRSEYPFYVAHGGFGEPNEYPVMTLRDDGNYWRPKRSFRAFKGMTNVPFRTVLNGWLEVPV